MDSWVHINLWINAPKAKLVKQKIDNKQKVCPLLKPAVWKSILTNPVAATMSNVSRNSRNLTIIKKNKKAAKTLRPKDLTFDLNKNKEKFASLVPETVKPPVRSKMAITASNQIYQGVYILDIIHPVLV